MVKQFCALKDHAGPAAVLVNIQGVQNHFGSFMTKLRFSGLIRKFKNNQFILQNCISLVKKNYMQKILDFLSIMCVFQR